MYDSSFSHPIDALHSTQHDSNYSQESKYPLAIG